MTDGRISQPAIRSISGFTPTAVYTPSRVTAGHIIDAPIVYDAVAIIVSTIASLAYIHARSTCLAGVDHLTVDASSHAARTADTLATDRVIRDEIFVDSSIAIIVSTIT